MILLLDVPVMSSVEMTLALGNDSCEIPDLPEQRHDHVTLVTWDGIVASCGGYTQRKEDSCLTLNIVAHAWEYIPSKIGNLPRSFYDSATVTLPVGVYIIGGENQKTSLFLPTGSSEWQNGPMVPKGDSIQWPCAVGSNDRFMFIGGSNERTKSYYNHVYQFDTTLYGPTSHLGWFQWPHLNEGRSGHGCAMISGKIIVAGGWDGTKRLSSTEIIDLSTQTVSSVGNLQEARSKIGMVTIGNGRNMMVLAFGGVNIGGTKLNTIEKWNDKTENWEDYHKTLKVESYSFGSVAVNPKAICRTAAATGNKEGKFIDICFIKY